MTARSAAATARLATAATLARQADHPEIEAWTLETQAWSALTDGDYRTAAELAQGAQTLAPAGSSAFIQATAQEGRAFARLGQPKPTYDAIDRGARLAAAMPRPTGRSTTTATTRPSPWPTQPPPSPGSATPPPKATPAKSSPTWRRRTRRRLASSRRRRQIDLGLALIAANKPDEAAVTAQTAIISGRIVPSNHWRALEVVTAVEQRGLPEATELRDAYETLRRGQIPTPAALPPADPSA